MLMSRLAKRGPLSMRLVLTPKTLPDADSYNVIADLPGNYLNWFAREGFPPGELGRLLALMHELDHNGLSSLLDPLRKRPNVASETSPRRSIGKTP